MTPRHPWPTLCAALALTAVLAQLPPPQVLDWQPTLATSEPWRALTAAFVHWTPLHLAANLAGCAALALLGARAGLHTRESIAGLIALPLTQLGLLLRPDLQHYGGLSGELHALAAIAALTLLTRQGSGPNRPIGAAIALGLVAKIALEHPLGPALRPTAGFDFPVAPFAHFSGALAGVVAWALTMACSSRMPRSPNGT